MEATASTHLLLAEVLLALFARFALVTRITLRTDPDKVPDFQPVLYLASHFDYFPDHFMSTGLFRNRSPFTGEGRDVGAADTAVLNAHVYVVFVPLLWFE